MKKAILSLAVIFMVCSNAVEAQTKVGTIDIDYLIMNMPEIESIQKNLKEYGSTLDTQLNEKMVAYQSKLDDYNKNVASYTEAQKEEKQAEVFALEEDITKFRQNGMQMIKIREDELKRPLYQKIATALEKVAKGEGYTQVLTISEGSDVVYLDPAYDITLKVAVDLGLEIED